MQRGKKTKPTHRIFMKTIPEMCLYTEEIIRFWTSSACGRVQEFFKGFFNIARWGIFSHVGSSL